MMRMPDQKLPKLAYQVETDRRRPKGIPRSTWKENVMEAVNDRGVTWRGVHTWPDGKLSGNPYTHARKGQID